jgi:glycyl-radical enzyme activating protein
MERVTGQVFAVEGGSFHDGPGVRTTVFLKGCPLRCLWCHNPESQSKRPELYFLHEKCTGCGACIGACPNRCHAIHEGNHRIDWKSCSACGTCVEACPSSALEIKGRDIEPEAIIERLIGEKAFFDATGGGLTLSGGEPFFQFDFSYRVLSLAKKRGIHTCIETCGFAPRENMLKMKDVVDVFLYDFKESDPEMHRRFTGVGNEGIIGNLLALDAAGARTILRCPIVPGLNDRVEHLHAIAGLVERLANVMEVHVMSYHPMGSSKSGRIGRDYPLGESDFPGKPEIEGWMEAIRKETGVPVRKG